MHHVRHRIAVTTTVAAFCLAACSSTGSPTASTTSAPATTSTSTASATPTTPPTSGSASASASVPASASASASSSSTQISITKFVYSPATLTVAPGATVTVVNHDSTAHTVTGTTGNSFDTGTIAPGATATFTAPAAPGAYPYFCTFHQFMQGTVTVRP